MNILQRLTYKYLLTPLVKSAQSIGFKDGKLFKAAFDAWLNNLQGDKNSGYVSSCANIWGLAFSRANFRLYDIEKENEEVPKHPVLSLLKKPFPGMTSSQMKYRISDDLIYEGNTYWLKLRDSIGVPRYIYPLYADKITTYPVDRDIIEYYEYGSTRTRFEPQDVIHIQNFNRSSNIKGVPVISKIEDVRTTERLQIKYRKQLYEKAGFLGPIFSTPKSMGDDEYSRAYEMLKAKFSGETNNFNFGLFTDDLKPVPTAYSPKDMQIIEDRELNRDEICAAFGVNKLLFGLSENIQRGNADTVYYVFYSTIIDPLLDHIDQSLTQAFEFDFSFNGSYPYEIKHDTLAQRDVEADVNYYTKMSEAGLVLPSEVRLEEGYPYDERLDNIWLDKMSKAKTTPAAA